MTIVAELRRRNVFRVGIAYAVASWLLLQIADVLIDNIGAPDWVFPTLLMVLGIGFPLSLIFAWAFELTPEGIKRESAVDRGASITLQTGRKLDRAIIVVLALAVGYLLVDKLLLQDRKDPRTEVELADATPPVQGGPGTLPTPSEDRAIAVLPFANRSMNSEDAFFTDGIHDDLLTQLTRIEDVKVISRTSVMAYRDTDKRIPEIASELGVSHVLEGGVQRAGSRIRINAQLIDVSTDEHLWAETFDREMTVENIFDIQTELTEQIVLAVRGELSPAEFEALSLVPTDNLEAYEAWLRANEILRRVEYSAEKFAEAEPWAQRATELDPGFGEAWATLSMIHGQLYWLDWDTSQARVDKARAAVEMAERLIPGSGTALVARGEFLYRTQMAFDQAYPFYVEASQAMPGSYEMRYLRAMVERRTGRFEDAIRHLQLAIDMEPSQLGVRQALLDTLIRIGDYGYAEQLLDQWSERYPEVQPFQVQRARILMDRDFDLRSARRIMDGLDPWNGPLYVNTNALLYLYERDYDGYRAYFAGPGKTMREQNVFYEWWYHEQEAFILITEGRRAEAEALIEALVSGIDSDALPGREHKGWAMMSQAYAEGHRDRTDSAIRLATEALAFMSPQLDPYEGIEGGLPLPWSLARAGRTEEALDALEALMQEPASAPYRATFKFHPYWDFLRDEPRFVALYEQASVNP